MKTKFKDFLLYSLACIGLVSLFISANYSTLENSTVHESHVWEMYGVANDNNSHVFSINKITGEVRKHETSYTRANDYFGDWKPSQNN